MTLVAYAKENGLRLGSLYRWKTVLGRTITAKREIVKAETEPRALKFLEVSVEQPRSSNRVEIVTPRGWTVRVEVNADNGALSRVLDLVEGRR